MLAGCLAALQKFVGPRVVVFGPAQRGGLKRENLFNEKKNLNWKLENGNIPITIA